MRSVKDTNIEKYGNASQGEVPWKIKEKEKPMKICLQGFRKYRNNSDSHFDINTSFFGQEYRVISFTSLNITSSPSLS